MPRVRPPNLFKPWSAEEDMLLRRLAEADEPQPRIAERLGRSVSGVSSRAVKLRVSVGRGGGARSPARKAARRGSIGGPPQG